MSIPAISGFTPMIPQTLPTTSATPASKLSDVAGSEATSSTDFASLLNKGMSNLQGLQGNADALATQAATGDLNAIHDYTIAATEASTATQLTTAVRNKALEAFQEIMRMSV